MASFSSSFNHNSKYSLILRVSEVSGSVDIATNTSKVYWELVLKTGTSYFYKWYVERSVVINGKTVHSARDQQSPDANSELILASGTETITHDSNGDKTISCSASASTATEQSYLPGSASVSGSLKLSTVPRYATSNQSLNSKTETTIKMNWSSDNTCDYIWYSKDNGSSWTAVGSVSAKSGSYTISGLSANTTYKIKTRVRRKDSQLTTDSSSTSVATYDYPHCTSTPDFMIGDGVTLNLYNPLNRSVNIIGKSLSDEEIFRWEGFTGTSIFAFTDGESVNKQYASLAFATEGQYKVDIVYGSITKTRNNYNIYKINPNNCKPVFTDFEYSTDLSELTGNNDTVINGKTTTTFKISPANKAEGSYSAIIVGYRVECGSLSKTTHYSTSDEVVETIENCTSNSIKVTAIDSRGLETTVPKTISNFKTYSKPSFASGSTERNNGVDSETHLNLKMNYWNGNFGSKDNKITGFRYRTKKATATEYGSWFEQSLNNLIYDDDVVSVNDLMIHENGSSGGFAVGVAYNIQVQISDGADNYILETVNSENYSITDGKVALSVLKDNSGDYHVGVNGMPILNSAFSINGVSIVDIIYPVGSIYMSVNSTSPQTLFGGTWEKIKDKFLLSSGDSYSNGNTGGASTHTHSINGHTHTSAGHTHSIDSHNHTSAAHTHGAGNYAAAVNISTAGCTWIGFSNTPYTAAKARHGVTGSYGDATNDYNTTGAFVYGTSGSTTPGNTGGKSLTTNSTTPGATGSTSLTTNSSSSLPPYLVVNVWKRTA